MSRSFLTADARGLRVRVHLQPRAAHNRVVGQHGDALKAQVTAPPVDGRANQALERLLAELTDLPPSAVRVVAGARGRHKLVELHTSDVATVCERLQRVVSGTLAGASPPRELSLTRMRQVINLELPVPGRK